MKANAAAAAAAEAAKPPKRGRGRPLGKPPPAMRALESQAAASASAGCRLSHRLATICMDLVRNYVRN